MAKSDRSIMIENARIITESGIIESGSLLVEDGLITSVGKGRSRGSVSLDARGLYVGPGFIDLHAHGGAGANFLDGDPVSIRRAVAVHARHGTTSMLATIGTAGLAAMESAVARTSNAIEEGSCEGLLGIHLEGPFLNPSRCGAQPAEAIRLPERGELLDLMDLAGEHLKLMTLAPEVEGGISLIPILRKRGVVAALGHSDADAVQAQAAFEAGAGYVTHLFNAMSGLNHRRPGLAVAALMEEGLPVELIADGVHVDPLMLRLAARVKGWAGIVIATDCMEALESGSPVFRMGGRKVTLREGVPRMEGGVLCGTMLTMARAAANLMRYAGAGLTEAISAGTINPARVIGVDGRKGSIAEGKDADLVVFDDDIKVMATVIGGRVVYNDLG